MPNRLTALVKGGRAINGGVKMLLKLLVVWF